MAMAFRSLRRALGASSSRNAAMQIGAPLLCSIRDMSSSKLFIGGLAWGVDDNTLRSAFESYGQITDSRVILDRETGRSRGFGFVNYTTEEEAKSAIEGMDGKDLGGRSIRVDYASDRPSAPRQDFNSNFNFNSNESGY